MSSSLWLNAYSLRPTSRYYTCGEAARSDELPERLASPTFGAVLRVWPGESPDAPEDHGADDAQADQPDEEQQEQEHEHDAVAHHAAAHHGAHRIHAALHHVVHVHHFSHLLQTVYSGDPTPPLHAAPGSGVCGPWL